MISVAIQLRLKDCSRWPVCSFRLPAAQQPVKRIRHLLRASTLLTLIALAACGDDGGGSAAPEVTGRSTLAYVVTECREDARTVSAHQKLVIRQGEREVTVREFTLDRLPPLGLCRLFAYGGTGYNSVIAMPFQRLGISRDGSAVAFEVTDDHSILAPVRPSGLLPPGEEEGIFVVQADSELRASVRQAVNPPSDSRLIPQVLSA
jgi:hypothetical protein